MGKKFTIIGLGEILWDIFPNGKKIGGAPANFAYHISSLDHNGIIVSRVGDDELGEEIVENLKNKKLINKYIQRDKVHPTGTVEVILDKNNQPDYIIKEYIAWDFIEWQDSFKNILNITDAICFSSLVQRNNVSRNTVMKVLKKARKDTELIFDINLRQDYYNRNVIEESLKLATILKLNNFELEVVKKLFGIDNKYSQKKSCNILLKKYNLKLLCLTKGEEGSMLMNEDGIYNGEIFPYKVIDRVGAGDAFTAAAAIKFLEGSSLEEISYSANRLASWVTSKNGGMPAYDDNPQI